MIDPALSSYVPTITLLTGAGIVLGFARAFIGWTRDDNERSNKASIVLALSEERDKTKSAIRESLEDEREKLLAELGAEIAQEREQIRLMVETAIQGHVTSERAYIDGLRDQIAEYHRQALQAIQDAKSLAVRVSGEYQHIRTDIEGIKRDLEGLKRQVRDLEKRVA